MLDEQLPLEQRAEAARILVESYGAEGIGIVEQWAAHMQLEQEASALIQAVFHPMSSWQDGPLLPKIVGSALIVVGTGGAVCNARPEACARVAEAIRNLLPGARASSEASRALPYSDRLTKNDLYHRFPHSFDSLILRATPERISATYRVHRAFGYINGQAGNFEIGVDSRKGFEEITHRFFNRLPI